MTDEPETRKHGVGYWCSWAIAALVLYPVSFGPVCWIADRVPSIQYATEAAYSPLGKAVSGCPDQIRELLNEWGQWGRPNRGGTGISFFIIVAPYMLPCGTGSIDSPEEQP